MPSSRRKFHVFTTLIGIVIILLAISACNSTRSPEEIVKEVTRIVTKEIHVEVPVTVIVTREVTVIATKEVTKIVVATPTPSPTPVPSTKGTRKKPIPFNEEATYTDESGHVIKLKLVKVARGKEAEAIINRGKEFFVSKPGEPNHEFFVAYFNVEYVKGPGDDAVSIDFTDFSISVDNKLFGTVITTFEDEHELDEILYPGAKAEGWVPFQIPEGSEVQAIMFNPDVFGDGIWFAVH